MKMSEILRKLADIVDSQDTGNDSATKLEPVEPESGESEHINTQSMVAPLQQKLELLKKAVGVDSHFDDQNTASDEVDILKKNAGIRPAVVQIASDDEPLDM